MTGKKLPDWKNGVYRKVGSIEIVEFPLVKGKTSISIPNNNLSGTEYKQIAEASLTRIVFIKKGDEEILIREIDYIPELSYLKGKSFDISHNNLTKIDNNFSGILIIKKWNGMPVVTWGLENGKFTYKSNSKINTATNRTSDQQCGTLVTEYERDCTEMWYGDVMAYEECGPWTPTGNSWFFPYPCENDPPNCDPNLSNEECACQLYQICGGGDGGDEEAPPQPPIFTASDETGSITTNYDQTGLQRDRHYRWVFLKGITLTFTSYDKGTHTKGNDGLWRFSGLQHVDDAMTGTFAGWDISYELNGIAPTHAQFHASMHFDCTVTSRTTYLGRPIVNIQSHSCRKYWHINDGN